MPMSKDEFKELVSTEVEKYGEFQREYVLPVDLSPCMTIAKELGQEIHYVANTHDDLYTVTIGSSDGTAGR